MHRSGSMRHAASSAPAWLDRAQHACHAAPHQAPRLPVHPKVSDLKKGIASFYDESSGLWEDMWGAHMHHGERAACACQRASSF